MFRPAGRRTRRLTDFLRKRTKTPPGKRPELDGKSFPQLFRKRGVVFTDTADFTLRTARDGILHFLMVFDTVTSLCQKVVKRTGGEGNDTNYIFLSFVIRYLPVGLVGLVIAVIFAATMFSTWLESSSSFAISFSGTNFASASLRVFSMNPLKLLPPFQVRA